MAWKQFVMDLGDLDAEGVETVFARHGACSLTLSDAGAAPVLEPAPGETPLWSDTRISALFPDAVDLAAVSEDLMQTLGVRALPPHRIESLADRAWEREWLRDFGPMRFGKRLWICPSGFEAPDNAVVVKLDPGLAFGTGTHPSTALCLEWLDGRSLAGRSILDVGCGSGVLAIAALKLGCVAAVATDIDPQAITATRANAKRNAVHERLRLASDDAEIDGQFDIVVANILAGPLVAMAESVALRVVPGGELALAGILSTQAEQIEAAYGDRIDFDPPVNRLHEDQCWTLMSGRRKVN